MFILCGNIAGSWKKIDMAVDEKEIVDTMQICHDKYKLFQFKINIDNEDTIYKVITTEDEYCQYIYDFKSKIKPLEDMSCVDLKRYILKKKTKK